MLLVTNRLKGANQNAPGHFPSLRRLPLPLSFSSRNGLQQKSSISTLYIFARRGASNSSYYATFPLHFLPPTISPSQECIATSPPGGLAGRFNHWWSHPHLICSSSCFALYLFSGNLQQTKWRVLAALIPCIACHLPLAPQPPTQVCPALSCNHAGPSGPVKGCTF